MACYPWWHSRFSPYRGVRYPGGYSASHLSESYVPREPEQLRANAENELKRFGLLRPSDRLTLDEYSLARNIASETGSGTTEQKVAMGLSTVNRARLWNTSVHGVVIKNTVAEGRYGPIHDAALGAPYGRFTSSSKEPTVEDVAIARFILQGRAGRNGRDFARGADDQAAVSGASWVNKLARSRSYWVGEIPGVNARDVMLYRKIPSVDASSPQGMAWVAAAINRVERPNIGPYPAYCVDPRRTRPALPGMDYVLSDLIS